MPADKLIIFEQIRLFLSFCLTGWFDEFRYSLSVYVTITIALVANPFKYYVVWPPATSHRERVIENCYVPASYCLSHIDLLV